MIQYNESDRTFYLETKNTTYCMHINNQNHLEHLYYGPLIEPIKNIDDVKFRYQFETGSSTSYNKESKGYMLDKILLEVSTYGKGDYREPTIHLELPNGSRTIDLKYKHHEIIKNLHFKNLPQTKKEETLLIVLVDVDNNIEVNLYYTPNFVSDTITRNLSITNLNKERIVLDKILSMNIDMLNKDYVLSKLDGAWIRERHISDTFLTNGTVRFDSKKGTSSSDHNPFFILKQKTTTEDYGNCFGYGLIYSGNFEANIEINPHNLLRANMGINSFDFRYPLQEKETFVTPEVIMTYSKTGLSTLSNNFHTVINSNIINENFQNKERPILVNNWEATYFDFNQKKLLAIAKKAKKLGFELFCLDDGWFGSRNDDYSSLGDWHYNKKKLPRGVKGIADKINKLGLQFGIWVEPEMINEDSELYRKHPEWVVRVPNQEPSLGRNQLILDLTNKDVVQHLKKTLYDLLSSANISYVKWDNNRNFSDVFSSSLPVQDQGKFHHLYILGLYEILEYITKEFPNILFESCSSGGNRFDLGMLYYMPQTWTSDNTDAYERLMIQEGTSMIYPLSSISNHVNGERAHQTFRHIPIETRFNVASFGVLGYELDLSTLTKFDEKVIQKQIMFYKEHRDLFQYGRFVRIKSVYDSNDSIWMIINKENNKAILGYFQKLTLPNPSFQSISVKGLNQGTYNITTREQFINVRTFGTMINHALPIKVKVNGLLHNIISNNYLMKSEDFLKILTNTQLEHSELLLHHTFTGTGQNDKVMMLEDFGSRLFLIEEEKNKSSKEVS